MHTCTVCTERTQMLFDTKECCKQLTTDGQGSDDNDTSLNSTPQQHCWPVVVPWSVENDAVCRKPYKPRNNHSTESSRDILDQVSCLLHVHVRHTQTKRMACACCMPNYMSGLVGNSAIVGHASSGGPPRTRGNAASKKVLNQCNRLLSI